MSHTHRFHTPSAEPGAASILIDGDEAHHALHVVRVKAGDAVELFDGAGRVWSGVILECGRKELTCSVESEAFVEVETPRVFISLAWLNKDKAVESLIQRGTELGVAGFRFFRGQHSVKDVKASNKWERWAVEACKQSGRVWVPGFEIVDGIRSPTKASGMTVLGVIREGEVTVVGALEGEVSKLSDVVDGQRDVNVVIGPEGDFSEGEYAALREAGVACVSLGQAVYRSQVAATVLATLVMYELGRMG